MHSGLEVGEARSNHVRIGAIDEANGNLSFGESYPMDPVIASSGLEELACCS